MKNTLQGERWVTSDQKRALDLALVGAVSPLALPLGAVALGASRIMDGREPLFRQIRVGRFGEPFVINKVRSMKAVNGHPPRGLNGEITALGKLIRPVAIDEIPQVLNVINGTMSVVGPRAMPFDLYDLMRANLEPDLFSQWEYVYQTSRPGGLSSFNIAYRLDALDGLDFNAKAQMDINDFEEASLSYDLRLIGRAAAFGLNLLRKPA